jgi:selenide,water dikinase
LSQQALTQVLRQLPIFASRNLLVGSATGDDAGVYRLDRKRALVQTTDFFTPIVDDAYSYGQISAANALSDVYAMGGRPLTALNIMGIPEAVVPPRVVNRILRGGADKIKQAHCVLLGGHTIRNPEPIYGLAVTGLVDPGKMLTNARARPGDLLMLTKPLGTGIVTTGIKRGMASKLLARQVTQLMARLNAAGAELAERGLVRAAVDVTGFGLLGHLGAMCRASQVGAEVRASKVPSIGPEVFNLIAAGCVPGGTRDNLAYAARFTQWHDVTEAQRILLSDAQTSGGLLLCVPEAHLSKVQRLMRRLATPSAAIIGRIVRSPRARIKVML